MKVLNSVCWRDAVEEPLLKPVSGGLGQSPCRSSIIFLCGRGYSFIIAVPAKSLNTVSTTAPVAPKKIKMGLDLDSGTCVTKVSRASLIIKSAGVLHHRKGIDLILCTELSHKLEYRTETPIGFVSPVLKKTFTVRTGYCHRNQEVPQPLLPLYVLFFLHILNLH